jgi:outer membrane lipoprotein
MSISRNLEDKDVIYAGLIGKSAGILLLVIALAGCAHIFSKDILNQVDSEISFEELLTDPGAYKGKVVLLGGVIVKAENKEEGTLLEIYQTEIDSYGRPINTDVSQGRFLALYEGFLDSEVYSKGRKITVAGVVDGEEVMKLGEIDYHYLHLSVQEIHLWEVEQVHVYHYHHGYSHDSVWYNLYYRYYPYWFYYVDPKSEDQAQNEEAPALEGADSMN